MMISNILTPTGSTLLSGPPLAWQQFVAREIVASATPSGGHIIWLGDTIEDGLSAVRKYGAWEKLRNRKTKGPHLSALAVHNIPSAQVLANKINSIFAEHDVWPRIIVRDVSRKVLPMTADDQWLTWLPQLSRLAPAAYLTVTHGTIRKTAPYYPFAFDAAWVLSDGNEPPPAERYGERWNLTQVPNGRTIKLHGHNYPSDVLFDLFEPKKEPAL